MRSHNSQNPRTIPKASDIDFYLDAEQAYQVVSNLISDSYINLFNRCDLPDHHRDQKTLLRRFKAEGISFLATTLPKLADGLFGYLERGETNYPNFHLNVKKNYPQFLGRIFCLVYSSDGKDVNLEIEAVRAIYQISVAVKKLRGPSKPQQLDRQIADFVAVDQGLPELPSDPESQYILQQSRMICHSIFKDIDDIKRPELFHPNPGPGATNKPVPHFLRFKPHQMFESIDEVLPYQEWFYYNPWEACLRAKEFLVLVKNKVSTPDVRYKSVPKQYRKGRGICIEHNETQYFQQAVKNAFYTHLEQHPETAGFICFTDQTVNQILALKSSETGDNCTLDMKEASDRVLRQLVLYHFEDNDRLTDLLMALSSPTIIFPKEVNVPPLLTKKYAAMGSGLCFPVMAVMHFCLIKAIYRLCAKKYKLPSLSNEPVWVYGDDIIVPYPLVEDVLHYLPRFGMKFNEKKSFWNSRFRESCGVHAYKGVDVTPVYFKHLLNPKRPGSLLSGVANEADLFNKGYTKTATYLRQKVSEVAGYQLPFVGRESACFGFMRGSRTDIDSLFGKFKHRYRKQMPLIPFVNEWVEVDCRLEFKLQVPVPLRDTSPPYDEAEGYLRYLVTRSREHDTNYDDVTAMKLAWRWVGESSL